MAREGGVYFTQRSLSFWEPLECECEYQIERSLTHMSEWRDFLIAFEWSVPGVEEEITTGTHLSSPYTFSLLTLKLA